MPNRKVIMEIIKKILVSILILCGIAFAGVVICCGIMIISPSTKIFGYSYLNTNSRQPQAREFSELTTDEVNIYVETGDFNIIIKQGERNVATLTNHVFGFTRAHDSNKYASFDSLVDEANGVVELKVNEPSGLFFTRETNLTIELSKKTLFVDYNKSNPTNPRKINIVTKTQNGKSIFGTSNSTLNVQNLSCSCTGNKGGIDLESVKIDGNLSITNILGRVNIKNEVGGEVTIDSSVGTYTMSKVGKLTVLPSSTNKFNAPSITVDEVGILNYTAQGGKLKINKCLYEESNIETNDATMEINTVLKTISFVGNKANITINKLGNFDISTSGLNSWNWSTISLKPELRGYFETNGTVHIKMNYLPVELKMNSGKAILDKSLNQIIAVTQKASVNVSFYNDGNLTTETSDEKVNSLNNFINNNFISKLSSIKSLDVKTSSGSVTAKNVQGTINIDAEKAPVTVDFEKVSGDNTIITSSKAVNITAPVENFVLMTRMNLNSKAKINIHFGAIKVESFNEDLSTEGNVERVAKYEDEAYKGFNVKVAEAKSNCADKITIINKTGSISAQGK